MIQHLIRLKLGFGLLCGAFISAPHTLAGDVTYQARVWQGDSLDAGADPSAFIEIIGGAPSINNHGQIAFDVLLVNPGQWSIPRSGIVYDESGTLTGLSIAENPVPGLAAGTTFGTAGSFHSLVLNDLGEVMFYAPLNGSAPTPSGALFAMTPDTVRVLAKGGDSVPGYPGYTYSTFGGFDYVFNNDGKAAFTAMMSGPDLTINNNSLVISDHTGELRVVAREGDPAPGGDGSNVFGPQLGRPQLLNDQNRLVFQTKRDFQSLSANVVYIVDPLTGIVSAVPDSSLVSGATSLGDDGLITLVGPDLAVSDGSTTTTLYDTPVASPIDPDATFGVIKDSVIHSQGGIAMDVIERNAFGQYRDVLYLENDKGITEIISSDVELPGLNVDSRAVRWTVQLNANGQVALLAELEDRFSGASDGTALFATDLRGNLNLIAYDGMQLDLDPAPDAEQLYSIRDFDAGSIANATGGEDGRARSFNDLGELVFVADLFDHGDTIIVAQTAGQHPADLNGDSVIDELDMQIVLASFGQYVVNGPYTGGDATGDSIVNAEDLNYILRNFDHTPVGVDVPEPAGGAVLLLGSIALLTWRRGTLKV